MHFDSQPASNHMDDDFADDITRPYGNSGRPSPPEHFDDANLFSGSDAATTADNFKVVIRVRPPVPRELHGYRPFVDVVQLANDSSQSITLCDAMDMEDGRASVYSRQSFTFDHVYGKSAKQEEVYGRSAKPAVLSVLEGYNATLIAYGQTGTGKTYTMEGFTSDSERGIIPRSIEEIFSYIDACRTDQRTKFLVRASYMQIYNEVISDLLQPMNSNNSNSNNNTSRSLTVRHTPQRGVYVDGLSEWIVRNPDDVYGLIERGTALRATSSTRMSELSSRSHAIFTIVVEMLEGDEDAPVSYRFGKLNIVDLAGSEKVRQTGVTGQRLEETKKINKSLHELGNVISALASPRAPGGGKPRHIPFRNSVLTSALRDSLGGNCKTTLIACISPALESYTESLSTLMFANRAKNIRNHAVVNEDLDQAMLLRKYERELSRLRQMLQEQHGGVLPTGTLAELQQGKRRAEADKEAALEALEKSSQVHQHEQELRQQLEARIHALESMLGSEGSGDLSEDRLGSGFFDRSANNRQVMAAEDKAQVERYKHLLLKQRDIMLNLTTRLNERDETILQLQEEIDAYDAHVQLLEDRLSEGSGGEQVVGPNHSGAVAAVSSKAQAEEYIRQCRVASSEEEGGGSAVKYRSDVQPSTLLSAEEKLAEVLTLRTSTNSSNGSGGGLAAKDIQNLKNILEHRAEEFVRHRFADRESAVRQALDAAALQVAASEVRCSLLTATHPQQLDLSAAQQSFETRAHEVLESLKKERTERRRVDRELDRMRFEVGQLLEVSGHGAPAQKAAVSRLWQALQLIEDGVLSDQFSTPASVADAAAAHKKAMEEACADSIRTLERLLSEKQALITQLQREAASPKHEHSGAPPPQQTAGSGHAEELAALSRELQIQKKDRKALQTIMEQRIKVKVDAIGDMVSSNPLPANYGDGKRSLGAEIASLQNLVNASIKAMSS